VAIIIIIISIPLEYRVPSNHKGIEGREKSTKREIKQSNSYIQLLLVIIMVITTELTSKSGLPNLFVQSNHHHFDGVTAVQG